MELQNRSTPDLTLVVATVERRNELSALLQSIPDAHCSEIEILIVDQNAEDLCPELATLADRFRITHIPVNVRNANAARNLGAKIARGAWLMFPDDDASFLPKTLERALEVIRTDRFDLITGQIVDRANIPHLLRWLPHASEITPRTIEHTLAESLFFIRRSLFFSVGGFDPLFGPGGDFPSAEGADLVHRIWRRSTVQSHYDPAIALYHPSKHSPLTEAARQRIHDFAMGEGAFTVRHYRALSAVTIGRKLLFRMAGTTICRGEERRRKIAYLRGFLTGAYRYCRLHRSTRQEFPSHGRSVTR